MESHNFIYRFTSKTLTLNRWVLFILFLSTAFDWWDSSDSCPHQVTAVVNAIGGIGFLSWIHAIWYKSNLNLINRDIHLPESKFFGWAMRLTIVCAVVITFLSMGTKSIDKTTGTLTYSITYTTPVYIYLLFVAGLFSIVYIAAKTLVSAEKRKAAHLNEYYITFWALIFAIIGLWFIQPRIQRLKEPI